MPHTPVEPKKKKQPTKSTAPTSDTHAPASTNPVNVVFFSFDHRVPTFKPKSLNPEK